MEKTPNIIYLDLTQNASAASLCGGLLGLAQCEKEFQAALASLGVSDIFPEVQGDPVGDSRSFSLILRDPLGMRHPLTVVPRFKKQSLPRAPRSARWSQTQADSGHTQNNTMNQLQSVTALHNKNVKGSRQAQQIWEQQQITLLDLKQCLKVSRLSPLVQGMCFRMFKKAFFSESELAEPIGLQLESAKVLTCYVLATALSLDALDPLGVTCSQVPFLNATLKEVSMPVSADKLLALATGLPTYDTDDVVGADYFSLSILKAVVTDWGRRPRGRITHSAIGGSNPNENRAFVQRIGVGLSGESDGQSLPGGHRVGWELTLSPTASLTELRQGLVQWGAENWLTLAVHTDTGQPATLVKVCLPQGNNVPAQKWCFEEGFTKEIHTTDLTISLMASQRVVLPWGKGAKQQQVSVMEHRWMDEVVQVIPNETDVARLAAESGFSSEAIRTDILNAWRRWNNANNLAVE